MRITDNRYIRDLRRHHLALRLIGHEARTQTICNWTGLSDERVRNLFQSYADVDSEHHATRHRGPSPNRLGFFLRSARMRNEAAALGGLFSTLDVLPHAKLANVRRELPTVLRGERMCTAYELYRGFVPESSITIEHAVMLVIALAQSSELLLVSCVQCGCSILVDRYGSIKRICMYCLRDDSRSDVQSLTSVLLEAPFEAEKQRQLF